MKILLITPEEFEGVRHGGVTSYVIALAKELHTLGHDISVLSPGVKSSINENGITYYKDSYHFPRRNFINIVLRILHVFFGRNFPEVFSRLYWSLCVYYFSKNEGPFDIIEAPEWGSSTLFFLFKGKTKVIVRLHRSIYQYIIDNKLPVTFSDRIIDFLERWCIFCASQVTSPTKFMSNQYPFISFLLHVTQKNIRIIPNGIQMHQAIVQPSNLKSSYILSAGRIEIGKGADVLIQAFTKVHAMYPGLKLFFVGEDTQMYLSGKWISCVKFLKSMCTQLKIEKNVVFLSRKKGADLENIYRESVAFILPSRGHENCSMSLLDAIAYGKMVIGSDSGGTPEIIHKNSGLIFKTEDSDDLAEKILYMLEQKKLRKKCEKFNLSYRKKFDVQLIAKVILDLYMEATHSEQRRK